MYDPVTTLDTLDFLCHPKDPITLLYSQNLRLLLGANILFFLVLSCVQVMLPFSLSDAGWLFFNPVCVLALRVSVWPLHLIVSFPVSSLWRTGWTDEVYYFIVTCVLYMYAHMCAGVLTNATAMWKPEVDVGMPSSIASMTYFFFRQCILLSL